MTIGVIDSGIGGLNVLASLIKSHVAEEYVYYADNANLPYGTKTRNELTACALDACRKVVNMGAAAVVLGCNTLSVVALDQIRKNVTTPVFGIIPPLHLAYGETLVLTTNATALHLPPVPPLCHVLPCGDLAELVEKNYPDVTPATKYLLPRLSAYSKVNCLLLGCSHYIYLKDELTRLLHPEKVLDGTENTAGIIKAVLGKGTLPESVQLMAQDAAIHGRKNAPAKSPDCNCNPALNVRFVFSGSDENMRYRTLLYSSL